MGEITLATLANDSRELSSRIGISVTHALGEYVFHVRIQGDDWTTAGQHHHLEVAYVDAVARAKALLKRRDASKH
jgi:hypothetical protein